MLPFLDAMNLDAALFVMVEQDRLCEAPFFGFLILAAAFVLVIGIDFERFDAGEMVIDGEAGRWWAEGI